jgi:hypothetical protein
LAHRHGPKSGLAKKASVGYYSRMGIRGELFSTRIGCEGRTYFFNVKENRMGDMFLTVVESKPTETEGFERRSVVIFRDDLPDFLKAFQGALNFMGKGEEAKKTVSYAPAEGSKAKKSFAPEGFAGGLSASGESVSPAPKKRLVVRRKPSAPKE